MTASILFKYLMSHFLYRCGILKFISSHRAKNGYLILMYHRIIRPEDSVVPLQPGMYVTPATFKLHLAFLKRYYSIISLDQLIDILHGGNDNSGKKPLCAITFDDGWLDFHRHAFPLLKKFQTQATVFLPTNYIGTHKWFWTDRLAFLLHQIRKNDIKSTALQSPTARQIMALHGSIDNIIEKSTHLLKAHPADIIEGTIDDLQSAIDLEFLPRNRSFINWQEARDMKNSGLVSFGSHTVNHAILTNVTDEQLQMELRQSMETLILEQTVDRNFIPFCYPNGNHNSHIDHCVESAGYRAGLTTEMGWNGPNASPFTLKRIGVHQDITFDPAMFGCRIAGAF